MSAELLKIGDLAERSGVTTSTIKHYLREGLLGEGDGIVRTSRNMAYYPAAYVEQIRLIKRLQEDRYMPLKVIKGMLDADPERARTLVELEDRILERAIAVGEGDRVPAAEVAERYAIPAPVLDRLEELAVLTPAAGGYDANDVRIIAAISRFRAAGYDEKLGFTVFDTLRYREALLPLVRDEVRVLLDRLAGEVDDDRAAQVISAGIEPLHDLLGALHAKLLIAELHRQHGDAS